MAIQGLRGVRGGASPPYTGDAYIWNRHVTFSAGLSGYNTPHNILYVDGNTGSDGNNGKSWTNAFDTIQAAVTASSAGDVIFIAPMAMAAGDTDPSNYAETIIIPATKAGLSLIGVNTGRTQGGIPQIRPGGLAALTLLTIRAPGCLITNLGFNGNSAAVPAAPISAGILLDDNGSTKTAFGTTIVGCHFKSCSGTTVTNAATGGAIEWSSSGGAWNVLITDNRFYKNVADIVVIGTDLDVPQDVVIENNVFSGPASITDCNIYVGGSGVNGLTIRNCEFQQLPALTAGTNKRYIILPTGTVGVIEGCTFGCQTSQTGTPITFKSGGSGANFPTTVHIMNCWGQSITADKSGEICIA